jgi:uncharacterized protein YggE
MGRPSAIAAAFIMTLIGCSSPALAQPAERGPATLTVSGQGRVEVPPDHARVTVEVVTKGASPDAATAAHRERASRAGAALRNMRSDGVTIEQSSFALSEARPPVSPNAQQPRSAEYRAVTTLELKLVPVANADQAMTALAATGLFEIKNLRFGIEDRNPGLDTARRNAVEDARRRATTYAEAAGVKLGDIFKLEDADTRGPREFALSAPMARSVQVIPPETLAVSASVSITWRIGQ